MGSVAGFMAATGWTSDSIALILEDIVMFIFAVWITIETTIMVRKADRREGIASPAIGLAAMIAGVQRHPNMQSQWVDHLATVRQLPCPPRQSRVLAGFLIAAVKLRGAQILGPLWKPVDWVLSANTRVNSTVSICCGTLTVYLIHEDGLTAFLRGDCLGVGVMGTGIFTLARWLRKVRGIELAELAQPGTKPTDPPTR